MRPLIDAEWRFADAILDDLQSAELLTCPSGGLFILVADRCDVSRVTEAVNNAKATLGGSDPNIGDLRVTVLHK